MRRKDFQKLKAAKKADFRKRHAATVRRYKARFKRIEFLYESSDEPLIEALDAVRASDQTLNGYIRDAVVATYANNGVTK